MGIKTSVDYFLFHSVVDAHILFSKITDFESLKPGICQPLNDVFSGLFGESVGEPAIHLVFMLLPARSGGDLADRQCLSSLTAQVGFFSGWAWVGVFFVTQPFG